jgi:hypothetical protein
VQLYSATSTQFIGDVGRRELAAKLQDKFFAEYRFHAPDAEVRAWTNSLGAMAEVIDTGGFRDHGVLVEYQLPLTSRRLDCMVTGMAGSKAGAVIVELKQWDYVLPSWVDECVTTTVGMRVRDVLHPSTQAEGYRRYLLDTNTAFSDGEIRLDSCAYLHNLSMAGAGEIFAPSHETALQATPTFVADQAEELKDFMQERLADGEGLAVLERVVRGRYRPHKQLLEHTAKVIRNEPAWVLLDEQQVAFNAVLTKVRERHKRSGQAVFLITGGPGVGAGALCLASVEAEVRAEADGQGTVGVRSDRTFERTRGVRT